MAVSAKNRGNGFRAYMAAFADSVTQGLGLRIELDPEVVRERTDAGKPMPPPDRVRQNEAEFYLYLATLNSGDYDLSLDPNSDPDVNDAPDHAILHRTYVLTATAADGTTTQLATCKVELELRRLQPPSPNWVITRWTDSILSPEIGPNPADAGLYCFSRLRIDGYNR